MPSCPGRPAPCSLGTTVAPGPPLLSGFNFSLGGEPWAKNKDPKRMGEPCNTLLSYVISGPEHLSYDNLVVLSGCRRSTPILLRQNELGWEGRKAGFWEGLASEAWAAQSSTACPLPRKPQSEVPLLSPSEGKEWEQL